MYVTQWEALNAPAAGTEAFSPALMLGGTTVARLAAGSIGLVPPSAPSSVLFSLTMESGGVSPAMLPGIEAAFDLVRQQLHGKPAPTWLLTSGAQASSHGSSARPSFAGVMGLARSARQESPAAKLSCLDVSALTNVLLTAARSALKDGQHSEPEMSVKDGVRRVPRLAPAAQALGGPIKLHFDARGAISNLRVVSQVDDNAAMAAGEAKLRVRAVGLNFRDVLNVLGAYPGDPGPPGGDCAARGVRRWRRRLAPAGWRRGARPRPGGARLPVQSDARLLAAIDESLSFEQACTLPTTWCTVHMSLLAARPAAGHDVLLHAGAGGVGLTSREYCHLHRQSRDGERRPAVQALLPAQDGPRRPHAQLARRRRLCARRVEAARSRPAALRRSTACRRTSSRAPSRCCGEDGCLCEIGKRAVWSYERHEAACCNRFTMHRARLDDRPDAVVDVRHAADAVCARGCVRAARLAHGALRPREERPGRLPHAAGGANTGKVVVRIPKTAPTPPRGTHLLSGGTGGLGLVTGKWLGEGGASSVVLAARGGKVAAADGEKLRKIAECSFSVAGATRPSCRTRLASVRRASLARAARWRACGTRRACCRTGCCAARRPRRSSACTPPRRAARGRCSRRAPRRRSTRACSSRPWRR